MTAGEVINRIKANLGAPWREATYRDTFKFGGPDTIVRGIATSAFVSLEVIEKAAAAGLNMIIPHEVTYWNDSDDISALAAAAFSITSRDTNAVVAIPRKMVSGPPNLNVSR